LTSALDGNECAAARPGRFTPEKEPPLPIVMNKNNENLLDPNEEVCLEIQAKN